MKRFLFLIFSMAMIGYSPAHACNEEGPFQFGTFETQVENTEEIIVVDKAFLDHVRRDKENQHVKDFALPLFYLIGMADAKAVDVGFSVLGRLIENPKFEEACDGQFEVHGAFKKELAFTLARSDLFFHKGLCKVPLETQSKIIAFYKDNQDLYINVDPPWMVSASYQEDYCQ